MEVALESRRVVERFIGGEWRDDREHNGRIYAVQVKVNGEEELFNFEVFISGTALSTEVEGLEQILREKGWEEIVRRRITKEFRSSRLDQWPPKLTVRLTIQSTDLDTLVLPVVF